MLPLTFSVNTAGSKLIPMQYVLELNLEAIHCCFQLGPSEAPRACCPKNAFCKYHGLNAASLSQDHGDAVLKVTAPKRRVTTTVTPSRFDRTQTPPARIQHSCYTRAQHQDLILTKGAHEMSGFFTSWTSGI